MFIYLIHLVSIVEITYFQYALPRLKDQYGSNLIYIQKKVNPMKLNSIKIKNQNSTGQ